VADGREQPGGFDASLVVMTTAAGVAIEAAAMSPRAWAYGLPVAMVAAAWAGSAWTRRRGGSWRRTLPAVVAVTATAGLLRHGVESDGRVAALDVLLLGAAGGAMPALLAFAWQPRVAGLLGVLSGFAVVTATSFAGGAESVGLALAYCVAAALWMSGRAGRPGPTWRVAAGVAVATVVVGAVAGLLFARDPSMRGLAGFVPSSGGTGGGAASARSGVGDGPDEVAGDHATATGYDQTDRFAESAGDGLYDLWVESYGAPVKSAGQQQKRVGLRPDDVRVVEAPDRQDLRSGRRFELRRRTPRRDPDAAATRPAGGDALAYVEGRAPLHLRLTTFDHFDGSAWHEASPRRIAASLRPDGGGWFTLVDHPDCAAFGRTERHRIKLAGLRTDVLPMPPAPRRCRVGRVDKVGFFRESRGGLLGLNRDRVPAGSVVEVEAHTFDLARRSDAELVTPRVGRWAAETTVSGPVRALAERWAGDAPPGWRQVDAVVAGLRGHARLRRGAAFDDDVGSPLDAFLLTHRVGDDYHFATAAAVILDALGYRARLVGGLYADPADFDAAHGHTPVRPGDAHFWVEVKLRTGAWMPIEPTPGYRLLGPRMGWADHAHAAARRAGALARRNAAAVAGAALVLVAAAVWRRRLLDGLDLARWHVAVRGSPAGAVRHTLALLERRARRRGRGRAAHVTPSAWLTRTPGRDVAAFAAWVDRFAYGPPAPASADEVRAACRAVVRRCGADGEFNARGQR